MVTEIIIMILMGIGALFVLLAAIGVVRMPDLYLRISVTTKAATLGVGLILGGAGIYFAEASVISRSVAIICFLFLTAPIAAHMIGRTAYFNGAEMWEKTTVDEFKEEYERHAAEEAEKEAAKAAVASEESQQGIDENPDS